MIAIEAAQLQKGDSVWRISLVNGKPEFQGKVKEVIPSLMCPDVHIYTEDHKTLCFWRNAKLYIDRIAT